jgi:hypothetical protein
MQIEEGPYYYTDDYARAFAEHEGELVGVEREWSVADVVYAYSIHMVYSSVD